MPRKSGLKRRKIEAGRHPSSQKANPQNLPITPRQVLFLKCGLSVYSS